ncbi:MAG: DUF45 domain-containing protein, partial [Betaproteobacteria bacterium]|nr:DUF45 domain-containing protein [Betaproteobacteria bacterium]
ALIANWPEHVQSDTTHMEVHPSSILGLLGNMIPYPNHNQSPRNQLSASQSKQGLSLYATNWMNRFDNTAHVLCYGQAPLSRTLYQDYIGSGKMSYGQNIILAMGMYGGYNQEDGIIMNADALQRGQFRSICYRSYEGYEEDDTIAHADWIARKLAVWRERRPAPFSWSAGAQLMLLGEPLVLAPDPLQTVAVLRGEQLFLPAKAGDPQALARAAIDWLRARANEHFALRVAHFAPCLGVKLPLIRLSNARTRWGTCHPHGRIHLNWRLIHMPPELLDYVVVHELAHLHEPNHSPRFWRHVERILPDHLQRRRRLRTDAYRFLLP